MSLLFINIVICIKFETLSVSFIFQKWKNLKIKRLSNYKLILQNLIITNVDVTSFVYILLCSTYMYKCIYITTETIKSICKPLYVYIYISFLY